MGSVDSTGLNLSLESKAMQGVVVCDTICHLPSELTLSLFINIKGKHEKAKLQKNDEIDRIESIYPFLEMN